MKSTLLNRLPIIVLGIPAVLYILNVGGLLFTGFITLVGMFRGLGISVPMCSCKTSLVTFGVTVIPNPDNSFCLPNKNRCSKAFKLFSPCFTPIPGLAGSFCSL